MPLIWWMPTGLPELQMFAWLLIGGLIFYTCFSIWAMPYYSPCSWRCRRTFLLLCLFAISRYPLTRERMREIRAELEKRRGAI